MDRHGDRVLLEALVAREGLAAIAAAGAAAGVAAVVMGGKQDGIDGL